MVKGSTFSKEIKDTSTTNPSISSGINFSVRSRAWVFSKLTMVNLEKTHARDLTEKLIPEEIDGLVVDVSFISLEKVLPFTIPFLKVGAQIILLVKPQFELGPGALNKAGVVKDSSQYPALLENIKQMALRNQLKWKGYMDSPILGGDGNAEFLGYFEKI